MATLFFPHVQPPKMVTHLADPHHHGWNRLTISLIVLHATAGTDSLGWLTTDSPRDDPVSAHALITRDGGIYRLVPDELVAWHAGPAAIGSNLSWTRTNVNRFSLGLELENLNNGMQAYPPAQINAAASLIAWWYALYGLLPIVAHHAIQTDKQDPFAFPWPALYQRLSELLCARP